MTRSRDRSASRRKLSLQIVAQAATVVAAIGAIIFGYLQYRINDTLMRMNQTVAVTGIVENGESGELLVRNTGKVNLYLAGFALGDKHWAFQRPILIAANTAGDPGYPVRPGRDAWEAVQGGGSATLTLFMRDASGMKWVSEIGFFKANDSGGTWMRSYETSRENWTLVLPLTRAASVTRAEYIEGARFAREPAGR